MLEDIRNNPVRIYSIFVAALTLLVYYVPSLPETAILGLVAAVCGLGGEITRGNVTPMNRVNTVVAKAVLDHVVTNTPQIEVTQPADSPTVRVIP